MHWCNILVYITIHKYAFGQKQNFCVSVPTFQCCPQENDLKMQVFRKFQPSQFFSNFFSVEF